MDSRDLARYMLEKPEGLSSEQVDILRTMLPIRELSNDEKKLIRRIGVEHASAGNRSW